METFTTEDTEEPIIVAKGTTEGLVIRIDSRASTDTMLAAFYEFCESRRRYLEGSEVFIDWAYGIPADKLFSKIEEVARESFSMHVKPYKPKPKLKALAGGTVSNSSEETKNLKMTNSNNSSSDVFSTVSVASLSTSTFNSTSDLGSSIVEKEISEPTVGYNLFGGLSENIIAESDVPTQSRRASEMFQWDEPDTRLINSTVRSGQRIESEHSIVILGDVNSGAEIVSGGDIIVLGTLRGMAHAGAHDETGGGRCIFALNLAPTQLRIGSNISRGARGEAGKSPELARAQGGMIVVEQYQPRQVFSKR